MAAEPATFGKYQILDRIAVGGMAEIYKARLDGIGGFHRTFAIKRILPHLTARTEFVDMLVDEAKIAGLLSHANIVQIMDLGEFGGTYYIAMEFIDGPDLGKILRRCRTKGITLPVPHAVFVCIEMLKGLEYAHNRQVMRGGRLVPLNIVHRDISPANVLVSFQGEVKLTDFGIAKASVKAQETVSGVIKGRFNYLSPEQATGSAPVDHRADLWATGVLLYEMLAGRHPYATDASGATRSEPDTFEAIKAADHTPPSHVNPDIPYQLELVLEQALKADPTERFQNATAMKEALDRFFHDAGFIFSHSTLAAFLKGLFPDEARTKRGEPAEAGQTLPVALPPPTDDQVTRPIGAGDLLDDRPATVELQTADFLTDSLANADTILRPLPMSLARVPDLSRSQAMGPIAGLGDESTLIRNNPLLDDARAWSEAETVIRPEPSSLTASPGLKPLPAAAPPPPPPAERAARPATRQPPAPTSPLKSPRASRPTPPAPQPVRQPRPRPPARPSRTFQVIYLALGAVVTLLILFVGALIGISLYRLASPEPLPTAATTRYDPEVEIHLPADASLYVDNRAVQGGSLRKLYLAAGTHEIRVEVPGHSPVETEVKVADNEVRVLSFEVQALKPEEK